MTRKHTLGLALSLASALVLTSCEYQKYNNAAQKDYRAGDEYVYGVHPDSAAVQTKNKYTEKPENEARAQKIREKLYGQKNNSGN